MHSTTQTAGTNLNIEGVTAHPMVRTALEDMLPGIIEEMNHQIPRGFTGVIQIGLHFRASISDHCEIQPKKIYRGKAKGQPQTSFQRRRHPQ